MPEQEPPPLYHGTRAGFRGRGGLLLPRGSHGGTGTSAPVNPGREPPSDSDRYVYVTTSKTLAWVYAWHAPGRGRPKVLTVIPLGNLEPDPEHSPAMEAYRCEAAVVERVDLNPEISEEDARQGWVEAAAAWGTE